MKTGEMYLPQSIIDVCKVWQKLGSCVLFPRNAITFMLCGSPNSTWVHSVAAALPAGLIARLRYEQGRLNEAESLLIDRRCVPRSSNKWQKRQDLSAISSPCSQAPERRHIRTILDEGAKSGPCF